MKTTKYALAMALGLIALVAPCVARADPIPYSFSSTLLSPLNGTTFVTGTFTVDSTTGQVTTWDFFLGSLELTPTNSGTLTLFPGNLPSPPPPPPGPILFDFVGVNCVTTGDQCGFVGLQFSYTAGFTSLSFQASTTNSVACFATVTAPLPQADSCLGLLQHPLDSGKFVGSAAGFASGSATVVPEPSSLLLLGTGLLGLLGAARRKWLALAPLLPTSL